MKRSSIVLTRARRRGVTESLKINNSRAQILHDINKLYQKSNEHGDQIDIDFEESANLIEDVKNTVDRMGKDISFLLRLSV